MPSTRSRCGRPGSRSSRAVEPLVAGRDLRRAGRAGPRARSRDRRTRRRAGARPPRSGRAGRRRACRATPPAPAPLVRQAVDGAVVRAAGRARGAEQPEVREALGLGVVLALRRRPVGPGALAHHPHEVVRPGAALADEDEDHVREGGEAGRTHKAPIRMYKRLYRSLPHRARSVSPMPHIWFLHDLVEVYADGEHTRARDGRPARRPAAPARPRRTATRASTCSRAR